MHPVKRRIVYVALYELIAITASAAAFALIFDVPAGHAGALSVAASVIATAWNFAFNTGFEWWEARQTVRGRSLKRRLAHAVGFEAGLILFLVPLMAWWLGIGLIEAFVVDIGLVVFFLVYTFVFNLAFDRVFGLPLSARPETGARCEA